MVQDAAVAGKYYLTATDPLTTDYDLLDISDRGTGTAHTLVRVSDSLSATFDPTASGFINLSDNSLVFAEVPNFSTNDRLIYSDGGGTAITTSAGQATNGDTFFVIIDADDPAKIYLSDTRDGAALTLTNAGSGTAHSFTVQANALSVDPQAAGLVNLADNSLRFAVDPGLANAEAVTYSPGSGSEISIAGSLVADGTVLYAITSSSDWTKVQLAASPTLAEDGTALDITAAGAGSDHTISHDATVTITEVDLTIDLTTIDLDRDGVLDNVDTNNDGVIDPELNISQDDLWGHVHYLLMDGGTGTNDVVTFDPASPSTIDFTNNTITFAADPLLSTGDKVVYNASGGTGITINGNVAADGDEFYAIVDVDNPKIIQLASSSALAIAGTALNISVAGTLASAGAYHLLTNTDSHTFNPNTQVDLDKNTIFFATDPQLRTGDAVTYNHGGGNSLKANLSSGGLADKWYEQLGVDFVQAFNPEYDIEVSLDNNMTLYAIVDSADPRLIKLSATREGALLGKSIDFTGHGSGSSHKLTHVNTLSFDASGGSLLIDSENDTFFLANHGYQTGDLLFYQSDQSETEGTSVRNLTFSSTRTRNVFFNAENDVIALEDGNDQTEITDAQSFYVIVDSGDPTQIQLAATPEAARAGIFFDLTGLGVGSAHSFTKSNAASFGTTTSGVVSLVDETITFGSDPSLTTGHAVTYSNGGGTSLSIDGAAVAAGTTFYVIVDANDSHTIQLAATLADANAGNALNLTAAGTGTAHTLTKVVDNSVLTFDPTAAAVVNTTDGKITFATDPQFTTDDPVTFTTTDTGPTVGGTAAANNAPFYVLVDANNPRTIQLASTQGGSALTISTVGSGTHTLTYSGSAILRSVHRARPGRGRDHLRHGPRLRHRRQDHLLQRDRRQHRHHLRSLRSRRREPAVRQQPRPGDRRQGHLPHHRFGRGPAQRRPRRGNRLGYHRRRCRQRPHAHRGWRHGPHLRSRRRSRAQRQPHHLQRRSRPRHR